MRVYAIRDQKADCFQGLHSALSDAEAIRQLAMVLQTDKLQLSLFPEDFSLYMVGEFNLKSGTIIPLDVPMYVISAVDAKKMLNKGE